MPRFFVNPDDIKNNEAIIRGEDVKHISKVLRLKDEDKIIICNGQGTDYECIIKNINKEVVEAEILSSYLSKTEPNTKVTLFQALAKSDKMDFIIQKAVEVGIHKIVPIITDRVVVKVGDEKKHNTKLARWRKVSESAAKQSQRGMIPEISPIITLSEAIHQSKEMDCKIVAYEKEKTNRLRSLLAGCNYRDIAIFIGPEGGFEENEISLAKESGIIPITLGNRILRTETAGLFLVSIMMYEMGEM